MTSTVAALLDLEMLQAPLHHGGLSDGGVTVTETERVTACDIGVRCCCCVENERMLWGSGVAAGNCRVTRFVGIEGEPSRGPAAMLLAWEWYVRMVPASEPSALPGLRLRLRLRAL